MSINPILMSQVHLNSPKQKYSVPRNNTDSIKSLNHDSVTFSEKSDIPTDSIKLLEQILPQETRLKNLSNITIEELRNEVNALKQTGLKMFDEIDRVKSDSSKLLPKATNNIIPNLCDFQTMEADYYILGDKKVLIKKIYKSQR